MTAIKRDQYSRPIALALREGLIGRKTSVFDYGCGLGDDLRRLRLQGYKAWGWDPHHHNVANKGPDGYDTVNLGYVINVIPGLAERKRVLRDAFFLSRKVLLVTARTEQPPKNFMPYKDGYKSSINTFQKFYTMPELYAFVKRVLKQEPVILAPGIVGVFKDKKLELEFLQRKYGRPDERAKKKEKRHG